MGRVVFYNKCRPQQCDAWPIALLSRTVFLGYPVALDATQQASWDKLRCKNVFLDVSVDTWDDAWLRNQIKSSSYRRQVSFHRRLAREIELGSIVFVSRPERGRCYAAEIGGSFQLVDRPAWAEAYFRLRAKQGLAADPPEKYIGDIVQTWPVKRWYSLPFTSLPRWISSQLLSRKSVGIISDLRDPHVSAYETVKELLDARRHDSNAKPYGPAQTLNLEKALLDWLTPASFEHLVVSLLQLKDGKSIYWHHNGGTGDGGVDAIGVDENGHLIGVAQCKWSSKTTPDELFAELTRKAKIRVAAILVGHEDYRPKSDQERFWNLASIAQLVTYYKDRLPEAITWGLV